MLYQPATMVNSATKEHSFTFGGTHAHMTSVRKAHEGNHLYILRDVLALTFQKII